MPRVTRFIDHELDMYHTLRDALIRHYDALEMCKHDITNYSNNVKSRVNMEYNMKRLKGAVKNAEKEIQTIRRMTSGRTIEDPEDLQIILEQANKFVTDAKKLLDENADNSCPPGKILNPATGRCVNINGKIGAALSSRRNSSPRRSPSRCPPGKILNPATGRCVKRDGKIGKTLV